MKQVNRKVKVINVMKARTIMPRKLLRFSSSCLAYKPLSSETVGNQKLSSFEAVYEH